jgi:hypothetical protein
MASQKSMPAMGQQAELEMPRFHTPEKRHENKARMGKLGVFRHGMLVADAVGFEPVSGARIPICREI